MKSLQIGFNDPTMSARCLEQLPGWVPIVAGDLMVVAMVDDLASAPVFAEALRMRDELRDLETMLTNLIGDLVMDRPINRAACEECLRINRDRIRALLSEANGETGQSLRRQALVKQMWKHQRECPHKEPDTLPRINIKCECRLDVPGFPDAGGTTSLPVIRVEAEDDGSYTAITNHWPSATVTGRPKAWEPADHWGSLADRLRQEASTLTPVERAEKEEAFRDRLKGVPNDDPSRLADEMRPVSYHDIWRQRAAWHFGIPESEVTFAQRKAVKGLDYGSAYAPGTGRVAELAASSDFDITGGPPLVQ